MIDSRDGAEDFPSHWRSSLLRPTSAHKCAWTSFSRGSCSLYSFWKSAFGLDLSRCCGWNGWRQRGVDMSSTRATMMERGSGRTRLTSWTLQRPMQDPSGRQRVTCNVASHSGSKLHLLNRDLSLPIRASISCQTAPVPGFGRRVRVRKILYIRNSMPSRLRCSAPNGVSRSPGLVDVCCTAWPARILETGREARKHGMVWSRETACKRRELL
jgi:hypothetical protein